jgi:hypothetical protein
VAKPVPALARSPTWRRPFCGLPTLDAIVTSIVDNPR